MAVLLCTCFLFFQAIPRQTAKKQGMLTSMRNKFANEYVKGDHKK